MDKMYLVKGQKIGEEKKLLSIISNVDMANNVKNDYNVKETDSSYAWIEQYDKEDKIPYTDYCTCFVEETKDGAIAHFYDEIKDRPIRDILTVDLDTAIVLMNYWTENAPENKICQRLEESPKKISKATCNDCKHLMAKAKNNKYGDIEYFCPKKGKFVQGGKYLKYDRSNNQICKTNFSERGHELRVCGTIR